jgi:hypothetical protein
MNVNELRVGNWVLCATHGIVDVQVDADILKLIQDGARYFHPIPLNIEILDKCGFFYQDNNSYQLDTNLGFSIWGRVESGFNVYVDSDEIGRSIKYLHQLQNVYFDLTGEELKGY